MLVVPAGAVLLADRLDERGPRGNSLPVQAATDTGAVRFPHGTAVAAFMGLMPIMWSTGSGADVMTRVAAPMVGGLATWFLMELVVYPAIYLLWKWHTEVRRQAEPGGA